MKTRSMLLGAAAFALSGPSVAEAQEPQRSITQWIVGGGPVLGPGKRTEGGSFLLGIERSKPESRLALRLTTVIGQSSYRYESSAGGIRGESSSEKSWVNHAWGGLQGTATYALTKSRVQPYLLGGAGLFAYSTSAYHAPTTGADEPWNPARPAEGYHRAQFGPVFSVGTGLNVRLSRVTMFGESRMSRGYPLTMPLYSVNGSPLVIGFKF